MAKLVRNEFIGRVLAEKEYVYDYSVIPSKQVEKNTLQVMCVAADKGLIDSYRAFFRRAGITLGQG
jgi:Tfp pilus assembly PilM family ATPase